ncbi:hypothetical protein MmiHf6_08910 [Methanimicrococcus hongohii]|uniref:Uncharacterized protein n=1 Tax=Methanimicrococcus hongohii TaxID=3028295 RepID=A0AA96VAV0_9EURY|nr:hypothetical protein [Methanimicrococcus sp. Hf6]WNY23582.1 hypothetical protein MmiHf6_08910 [Methanimicrococcus sp. Hf6]
MNLTEQKLTELIEYQKQLVDIGNYNYYQSAIDDFFYPAELLNVKLKSDLQMLKMELIEDFKTVPPFANAPITKYSDRLAEITDYYIGEGKFLGRPYPHIGKKQIKNSTEIITTLESSKNCLTDMIYETHNIDGILNQIDKIDRLITENILYSKSIIKTISKRMTAINGRLNRDLTKI